MGLKKKIKKEWNNHPYMDGHKHEDLVLLCCCSEYFCDADKEPSFNEIVFTVPKNWLRSYLEIETGNKWTNKEVVSWLQEDYTSDDSINIYNQALQECKIVTLNFN